MSEAIAAAILELAKATRESNAEVVLAVQKNNADVLNFLAGRDAGVAERTELEIFRLQREMSTHDFDMKLNARIHEILQSIGEPAIEKRALEVVARQLGTYSARTVDDIVAKLKELPEAEDK